MRGGNGGGGQGGNNNAISGGSGNTGGGGGAGGYSGVSGAGGGSGIVIIRYKTDWPAANSTTGSPTYTIVGNFRVYVFTSSGTLTYN